MKNLNHLVVMMTRQFSRTGSWRLGVWHALRRAAGVPSPELFTVDDLPALTEECRRIIVKAPKKIFIWCYCDMIKVSPSDRCPFCGRIGDRKRRFKRAPFMETHKNSLRT